MENHPLLIRYDQVYPGDSCLVKRAGKYIEGIVTAVSGDASFFSYSYQEGTTTRTGEVRGLLGLEDAAITSSSVSEQLPVGKNMHEHFVEPSIPLR